MKKIFIYKLLDFLVLTLIFTLTQNSVNAKENYFNEAKNEYEVNNLESAKFLLQRNIVFNPKDNLSYLYLAKIYKQEKNVREQEKNLNTTLLLNPKNEEALFMLIELEIERSNYSKIKELNETFELICSELCNKLDFISKRIQDLEPENNSTN